MGNNNANNNETKGNIIGRTDNPGNKQLAENNKPDISNIDRQEGSMDNGSVGPDFQEEKADVKKRNEDSE